MMARGLRKPRSQGASLETLVADGYKSRMAMRSPGAQFGISKSLLSRPENKSDEASNFSAALEQKPPFLVCRVRRRMFCGNAMVFLTSLMVISACGKKEPELGSTPKAESPSNAEILLMLLEIATPAFRGFKLIATLGGIALKFEREIYRGFKISGKIDLPTIRKLFLQEHPGTPSPRSPPQPNIGLREVVVSDSRTGESYYFPLKMESDQVLCISKSPLVAISPTQINVSVDSDETTVEVILADECRPTDPNPGLVLVVSTFATYQEAEALTKILDDRGFDASQITRAGQFVCIVDVDPHYTGDPEKLKRQVEEILPGTKTSLVKLDDLVGNK
jgi:hypothetical protein